MTSLEIRRPLSNPLLQAMLVSLVMVGIACAQDYQPRIVIAKPFPAIVEPEFLPAQNAAIQDDELVIGVAIGGQSRAYPVNQLTGPRREIINDTLGQLPIAATW